MNSYVTGKGVAAVHKVLSKKTIDVKTAKKPLTFSAFPEDQLYNKSF